VKKEALTELQLAVMQAVWEVGEGTVGEILGILASHGRVLAPTTVATLLQRLSKDGWVKHRRRGRQFLYRAKIGQKEAAKSMLRRVLTTFFGGKVSALAAQLLESEQVSREELEVMQNLIKKKES
jgi:BlaI family penicillinase repressor